MHCFCRACSKVGKCLREIAQAALTFMVVCKSHLYAPVVRTAAGRERPRASGGGERSQSDRTLERARVLSAAWDCLPSDSARVEGKRRRFRGRPLVKAPLGKFHAATPV